MHRPVSTWGLRGPRLASVRVSILNTHSTMVRNPLRKVGCRRIARPVHNSLMHIICHHCTSSLAEHTSTCVSHILAISRQVFGTVCVCSSAFPHYALRNFSLVARFLLDESGCHEIGTSLCIAHFIRCSLLLDHILPCVGVGIGWGVVKHLANALLTERLLLCV